VQLVCFKNRQFEKSEQEGPVEREVTPCNFSVEEMTWSHINVNKSPRGL